MVNTTSGVPSDLPLLKDCKFFFSRSSLLVSLGQPVITSRAAGSTKPGEMPEATIQPYLALCRAWRPVLTELSHGEGQT